MNISKKVAILLTTAGVIIGTAGAIGIQAYAQQAKSTAPANVTAANNTAQEDAEVKGNGATDAQDKNETAESNDKTEVGQAADAKASVTANKDQNGSDNQSDGETNDDAAAK